ncbi:HMG-box [Calocera cornea HHB12733]|uniref:HMG-box n=1 Tax=Calocera cornea HHB12733 TaxID=1353952 RepID=A0A165F0L6_9BASI|nr:HMG-box [Calocera cornea HHB12733]
MPKAITLGGTKTTATKSKLPSILKPTKPAAKDTKPKKATKEKKEKKEKDPNAPKGAKSPYIIFSQENREAAKEEADGPKDIMRILGEKWRALSEKDKAPYLAKAVKDKQRYEREMKAYGGKSGKEVCITP